MSKYFANLFDQPEAEIKKHISKFEHACGYPSEDVRLMAENKQKLRAKLHQMGLDADDTTDEELYYALLAQFAKDAASVDRAMGVSDDTNLDERLNKAKQLVQHCASSNEMWVVKTAAAKSVLSKNPPKSLAKKLHYRSSSSLIKREDTNVLYIVADVLESNSWKRSTAKHIAQLNASSYELRPLKIVKLPSVLAKEGEPKSAVLCDRRFGTVAIWPSAKLEESSVLALTILFLSGWHELNPSGYAESLHELSPALRWWADSEYLLSDGKAPVSFNLKDVAFNYLWKHDVTNAQKQHGRQNLWKELMNRYQQITPGISEELGDIAGNISSVTKIQPRLPIADELATEYVTVE